MLINLLSLSSNEFEDLICDLFTEGGYNIIFKAGEGPDGNRDMMLSNEYDDGLTSITRKYIVQCKRQKNTIGIGDVSDIRDTLERYNADGFILAVTSRISQPLNSKLADMTSRSIYSYRPLLPNDIYKLLFKHEDIFLNYFPDEFEKYKSSRSSNKIKDIVNYVSSLEDIELTEMDMNFLERELILFGLLDLKKFKILMTNVNLATLIKDSFKSKLNRIPTFIEHVHYMILLRGYSRKYWQNLIDQELLNSIEFLTNAKIIINFASFPVSNITFDEVYQVAYIYSTYHNKHKSGILKIIETDLPPFPRATILSSIAEEFRVICLDKRPLPPKKILVLDYDIRGFFQLFIRVLAEDNRFYYIQYIDGNGNTNIIEDRGSVYLQIYNKGIVNGPNVLRKELHYYEDLFKNCSIKPKDFSALFFGVKGELCIYQIMLI